MLPHFTSQDPAIAEGRAGFGNGTGAVRSSPVLASRTRRASSPTRVTAVTVRPSGEGAGRCGGHADTSGTPGQGVDPLRPREVFVLVFVSADPPANSSA